MKQLREIQKSFQSYLHGSDDAINQYIAAPTQDFAEERLYLYKDAYYLRLTDVLKRDYPGIFALLDEASFEDLATQYIDQNPSKYVSVNFFGNAMPAFLKRTQPYSAQPHLAEMATFERGVSMAIYNLYGPVLSPEAFATLPQEKWPEVRIEPHTSMQVLKLKYNIPEIWRAICDKMPLPELTRNKTTTWLVWQKELHTYYVMLSDPEAFVMESFKKNLCIAEICEGLCHWLDEAEVPQYLVNLILRWLHDKLLSRFYWE